MDLINPYNFVPLKDEEMIRSQRGQYPGLHLFRKGSYSGTLVCDLTALSPLLTLDQRTHRDKVVVNNNETEVRGFLRNSGNTPIIQGTSLKGLIRSVYEAITDSCMPLVAVEGRSRSRRGETRVQYEDIGAYKKECCSAQSALCPACRLFGTILEDKVNCRGRAAFGDAALIKGRLTEERSNLKELSTPKPHHLGTYGARDSGGKKIAGRKFYYHQGPTPEFSVAEPNNRTVIIDEVAPPGTVFRFELRIEDLDREELGKLLLALELCDELAHKIGLGKAIGLGSCCIHIDREASRVGASAGRYKSLQGKGADTDWYSSKESPDTLSPELWEVLRFNKYQDKGKIGYPSGFNYPSEPIDALGYFGGRTISLGPRTLSASPAAESEPTGPIGDPPKVRNDEQAAWLKSMNDTILFFVTDMGETVPRKRSGFQGKSSQLELGHWYVLSGTNKSTRA
jgi:CRISPR/Cas system CSM-associated protein Csm3 (group 7 of RAMP superfamily)